MQACLFLHDWTEWRVRQLCMFFFFAQSLALSTPVGPAPPPCSMLTAHSSHSNDPLLHAYTAGWLRRGFCYGTKDTLFFLGEASKTSSCVGFKHIVNRKLVSTNLLTDVVFKCSAEVASRLANVLEIILDMTWNWCLNLLFKGSYQNQWRYLGGVRWSRRDTLAFSLRLEQTFTSGEN